MGAKNHRELIAWQLANELRLHVIRNTGTGEIGADLRFREQMRDAVSSACRNTCEGFYKYRRPEFKRYLNIARGSLGELLDIIEDGHQREYYSDATAKQMSDLGGRAMIANLRLMQSLGD
jgi:four helix bundle protein